MGGSRSFAVRSGDEGLVGVFRLPRSTLDWWGLLLPSLPLLLFLGGGVDLGVATLCERIFFVFVRLIVENGTNCLFAGGVVGGSVEQLVGVGRTASRKVVRQVPARRAFEEARAPAWLGVRKPRRRAFRWPFSVPAIC